MGLNIIEAAKALKEGKKVRRKFWRDESYMYQWDTSNFPQVHTETGVLSRALVIEELLADDWEVIEEKSAMEKACDKLLAGWSLIDGSKAREFFEAGWKAHEDHTNRDKPEKFPNEEKPIEESINLWHEEIKNTINFLKGMLVSAKYYDAAASLREIEKRVEDHIKEQSK